MNEFLNIANREIDKSNFLDLVARMRKAQKDFFSSHSKSALNLSKTLERQVDEQLKKLGAVEQENKSQSKMF